MSDEVIKGMEYLITRLQHNLAEAGSFGALLFDERERLVHRRMMDNQRGALVLAESLLREIAPEPAVAE